MITFRPLFSSLEISIPRNHLFLHTCYFRLNYNDQISPEIRNFGDIAWETLSIIKENFPSKID